MQAHAMHDRIRGQADRRTSSIELMTALPGIPPRTFAACRPSGASTDRYHHRVPYTQLGDHADALGLAFSAGEAELRAVYDAHGSLIFGICRRTLGEEAAREVTQDVFVSAWRAREQFDPTRGTLAGWLVGITKRRVIDHVRRERRHSDRRADEDDRGGASSSEPELDRIADRMVVARALGSLGERPRQVITLAYVDGLTHQEIAERTGLPLGTIKSDIRRGLVTLRQHLESTHE
jgi:RNA polymerase sigma-70 factor (ECF subfamily)